MELESLKVRDFSEETTSRRLEYALLNKLIQELQNRELPPEVLIKMNEEIARLNLLADEQPKFLFHIKSVKNILLKIIKEELEIVPKNYYRNLWLALGMSSIGLPLGVVFSSLFDNTSFIAIGLPLGMLIGIAIGTQMDKKAISENRMLEIDIN